MKKLATKIKEFFKMGSWQFSGEIEALLEGNEIEVTEKTFY